MNSADENDDPLADLIDTGQMCGPAIEPDAAPSEPIPAVLHESDLAQLLGITANRVRTLARDGMVARVAPARYDVRQSLLRYLGDLRHKTSRLGHAGGKHGKNWELNAEKLRLTKAQADERELKIAAARGDLLDANEVRDRWTSYTVALRQAILAVGPRVATQAGLDRTAAATLDAELRLALEQIATEGAEADG